MSGEEAGNTRQLLRGVGEEARHRLARWRDKSKFPAMIDLANQTKGKLNSEVARQDNLFAGYVLDACTEMTQFPLTSSEVDIDRNKSRSKLKIADFKRGARGISIRPENADGIFSTSYPGVDTLSEHVLFEAEVDFDRGKDGDSAIAKTPMQLLQGLKNGDATGVVGVKIKIGISQSISPVPEMMRASPNHPGLDRWDEYEVQIRPVSSQRSENKDKIDFQVEVKNNTRGDYLRRSFAPYGWNRAFIFLQTKQGNGNEVVVVEDPQLPEVRYTPDGINAIVSDAKKAGMMDLDDFIKKYGYGEGSHDDPVTSVLWESQNKEVRIAGERLASLNEIDIFIQQFMHRVKNGPQNLVPIVYTEFRK